MQGIKSSYMNNIWTFLKGDERIRTFLQAKKKISTEWTENIGKNKLSSLQKKILSAVQTVSSRINEHKNIKYTISKIKTFSFYTVIFFISSCMSIVQTFLIYLGGLKFSELG